MAIKSIGFLLEPSFYSLLYLIEYGKIEGLRKSHWEKLALKRNLSYFYLTGEILREGVFVLISRGIPVLLVNWHLPRLSPQKTWFRGAEVLLFHFQINLLCASTSWLAGLVNTITCFSPTSDTYLVLFQNVLSQSIFKIKCYKKFFLPLSVTLYFIFNIFC